MPVYEYACGDCGGFTAVRPMSQYREPQPCPGCGASAPRALLSAPAFSAMPAASRIAHATNERSAHAPRASAEVGKRHGAGCSCCSTGKSNAVKAPDGSKMFPTKRPWMISH
jgi:putative FmdB family regulatory protein